jgi:predicted PilT family ATPase
MTIKAFREQSGARINISSSTSSERLVTVTGNRENICRAFAAIGKQIEQNADKSEEGGVTEALPPVATPDTPLTISFRLVIQSSQCGSLIGKGGTKIKDIRETTGVSIQVAGETLPNSTERAVTISGTFDALVVCVGLICNVMLENPPRGPFIPYKPHSLPNQAYQPRTTPNATAGPYTAIFNTVAGPATTTQQMRIPNDLIGCVIGRKGSKIHEIRVSSGAQIKIAGNEGDGGDRLVTITGTPEAVGMAQYLINSRIHSEVNSFITMGTSMSV